MRNVFIELLDMDIGLTEWIGNRLFWCLFSIAAKMTCLRGEVTICLVLFKLREIRFERRNAVGDGLYLTERCFLNSR